MEERSVIVNQYVENLKKHAPYNLGEDVYLIVANFATYSGWNEMIYDKKCLPKSENEEILSNIKKPFNSMLC